MKLGRQIYYDKETGYVIYDKGEMFGDFLETTAEEDFQTIGALSKKDQSKVGIVTFPYGYETDNFQLYLYRIHPKTKEIIWDFTSSQINKEPIGKKVEETNETVDILGQQLAEKDLQIIEIESDRDSIGQRLVDLELRLMEGGL